MQQKKKKIYINSTEWLYHNLLLYIFTVSLVELLSPCWLLPVIRATQFISQVTNIYQIPVVDKLLCQAPWGHREWHGGSRPLRTAQSRWANKKWNREGTCWELACPSLSLLAPGTPLNPQVQDRLHSHRKQIQGPKQKQSFCLTTAAGSSQILTWILAPCDTIFSPGVLHPPPSLVSLRPPDQAPSKGEHGQLDTVALSPGRWANILHPTPTPNLPVQSQITFWLNQY